MFLLPSAGAGSQPSGAKQSTAADPPVNGRPDAGKEKDGKAESGKPLQAAKEGDDKKKATTKAERRAIQERQRAEKAAAKVLPGVLSCSGPCLPRHAVHPSKPAGSPVCHPLASHTFGCSKHAGTGGMWSVKKMHSALS